MKDYQISKIVIGLSYCKHSANSLTMITQFLWMSINEIMMLLCQHRLHKKLNKSLNNNNNGIDTLFLSRTGKSLDTKILLLYVLHFNVWLDNYRYYMITCPSHLIISSHLP